MAADTKLIIFAKAPVSGEVNTRLIPHIGVVAATQLQQELIELRMQQFGDTADFDVDLSCAPDGSHPLFQQCAEEYDVSLTQQRGADLGERMSNAFKDAFDVYTKVLLIGTDAPAVEMHTIKLALEALDDYEVVLQPAEDGGYVLIGMQRYLPVVFHSVAWGSERVLKQTRANIVAAGLRWHELTTGWDIDTAEDLERFRSL